MAKNYNADSITVLEGLEAVRRRPGMYIGSIGSRGLNHLIYEILCHTGKRRLLYGSRYGKRNSGRPP